jgi:hypothetical protein
VHVCAIASLFSCLLPFSSNVRLPPSLPPSRTQTSLHLLLMIRQRVQRPHNTLQNRLARPLVLLPLQGQLSLQLGQSLLVARGTAFQLHHHLAAEVEDLLFHLLHVC